MQAKAFNTLGLSRACVALLVLLVGAVFALPVAAASAFQGSWLGPWREDTLHQSGEFLLVIDGTGAIEGLVTNGAAHGIVRGAIDAAGEFAAVYSYDGKSFFAAKGIFARAGDHLRGTAYYFTATKQPLGSSDLDLRLRARQQESGIGKIVNPAGAL